LKIVLFLDIIERGETFSEHGFQVFRRRRIRCPSFALRATAGRQVSGVRVQKTDDRGQMSRLSSWIYNVAAAAVVLVPYKIE
jgi:hypothetical protein